MLYVFQITGVTCEACTRVIKKRIEKNIEASIASVDQKGLLNIISEKVVNKSDVENALKDLTQYTVQ